jgi:mono/diheme cytochrome c family protein
MMRRRIVWAALSCLMLSTVPALAAGDAARGAKLHEDCLGCHGTELYEPPRARIKTLAALKKEVESWNDRMNPKFTKRDVEDLVAYLNASFYKFPR